MTALDRLTAALIPQTSGFNYVEPGTAVVDIDDLAYALGRLERDGLALEAAVVLLAKVIESMRKNDPAIFAAILPHIHALLDAYDRKENG